MSKLDHAAKRVANIYMELLTSQFKARSNFLQLNILRSTLRVHVMPRGKQQGSHDGNTTISQWTHWHNIHTLSRISSDLNHITPHLNYMHHGAWCLN